MPTTQLMGLSLPTPTVTQGPEWASQLNTALTAVDAHDHSTGKGTPVTPLGLNINSDLSFGSNNLDSVKSVRFANQSSALEGSSDIRSIYVRDNALYYNTEAGTPVRIITGEFLDGGSIGGLTANRAVATDSLGAIVSATTTATELGYLSGVTSALQTQIDGKIATSALTTNGDLLTRTAGAPARIGIGAANTVLTSDGSAASYAQIVNANVSASAAIAYSKLNLATSIVNADISASAAIARSKLANGSNSHVLINDGSGVMSSEASLAISRGGTGQSSKTEAFDALSPTTTKGDLIVSNGTDNVRLPVGTNGKILSANSAQSSGIEWVDAPSASGDVKNYIINGDMRISQRGTSFVSPAGNSYLLDRWRYFNTTSATHTITQDTDVPAIADSGYDFKNSMLLTLTAADTSMASGDLVGIQQRIEGYNFTNLAQKSFTLSFWVKATTTGTYVVSFRNSGGDRSYVAEYTINTTNTWEKKTITVSASPTAGTWDYTNGVGLQVSWTLASGSSFQTTAGAWQTGNFLATSNQVNGVNTGSTLFRITGVMLNAGISAGNFNLFGGSYQEEFAACERYYEKLGSTSRTFVGYGFSTGTTGAQGILTWRTLKRTTPSVTISSASSMAYNNASNAYTSSAVSFDVVTPLSSRATLTVSGVASANLPGTFDLTANNYVIADIEL